MEFSTFIGVDLERNHVSLLYIDSTRGHFTVCNVDRDYQFFWVAAGASYRKNDGK